MTLTPAGLARGLLHVDPTRPKFQHWRYLPEDDLAPFVEHFWIVEWDLRNQAPHVQTTLPHPSIHLVFEDGRARIVGVCRGRFTQTLEGRSGVLGVKFRSGGFHSFFKSSIAALTNQTIDASQVLGADVHRVASDVRAARAHEEQVAIASAFLRAQQPVSDPHANLSRAIVERILGDRAITKVGQLTEPRLSVRQVQRLFHRYVGVSPKWVIERYRIHEALDRVTAGEHVDWAKLAVDLGYFDQAHFIRAFKRFVGETPAEYARPYSRERSGPTV